MEFSPLLNMGGFNSAPIVLDNEDGERQDLGLRNADAAGLEEFQQIQNISLLRDFFLNYSKGAAEYLIQQAFSAPVGYCWNQSNTDPNNYTGLAEGTAGIGSFLLDLFTKTANESYLQYAVGAGQWLMSQAISSSGGYCWGHQQNSLFHYTGTGLGAAGIGQFFNELFQTTGNITYLNYSESAARWLDGQKIETGGKFSWHDHDSSLDYYLGRKTGMAGIAEFFLDLFERTGNASYRALANGTLKWLMAEATSGMGGYAWYISSSQPATYATGHDTGAAGIGQTFLHAFQTSGNQTFMNYAKGAAEWLDGMKIAANGGYKWIFQTGTSTYYLDYEIGAAGIGEFFLDLFHATGNQTLLSLAKGAAQWIVSQTNMTGPGYKWPRYPGVNAFYTGLRTGTAGVARFLLDLYTATGNSSLLEYIQGGAKWLVSNATASGLGFCWNYYLGNTIIPNGLYVGAAGIGQCFVELAHASWTNGSLNIVTGAADWLISYAYKNPVFGGYQWWEYGLPVAGMNYTGKYTGAAGIGEFFLDAFERTGNSTYLDYAVGAADWLLYKAYPRGGGFAWPKSDSTGTFWTGQDYGAAGIGQFFIKLFQTTGNLTYLETVKNASQWLISNATARDGGYFWRVSSGGGNNYTGYREGAAGIGSFFLDAFSVTENQTYLNYARGAAQWLVSNATASKGGWCWRQYIGSNVNYTGYEYGAAGIGDFLYKAFHATGNVTYRNYANGAARWLINMANPDAIGLRWPENDNISPNNYTNYASGAAGIGAFFLNAFAATGNVTYLNIAEAAAQWLQYSSKVKPMGLTWPQVESGSPEYWTGLWSGVAGIGLFFHQAFLTTGNQSYLHYSRLAAQWLVFETNASEGGYRWIQFQDQLPTPFFATGQQTGTAGIGSFFASGVDLDLLPPTIGTPNNGTPVPNVPVMVSVPVTDDYAVDSVILSLTVDNGLNWDNYTMTRMSGFIWTLLIGPQPEGSTVNYTIYANDSMDHLAVNDNGGTNFSYSFPAVPPVIQDPSIGTVVANSNVTVNVSVTDNVAVHTVILSWDNNTGYGWKNITMTWVSGTTYQGNVTGHVGGTFIKLQFFANDTANIWGHNDRGGLFFNYTVPFISIVDPKVNNIVPFTTVYINVTVNSYFSVDKVILSWSNNGGTTWFNVTMGSLGGSLYQGPVSGHPEGYEIKYNFYANDTTNNIAMNDNGGANFSYTIPATPPTIIDPIVGNIAPFSGVQINATVTDNVVVDTVILSWSNNGGTTWFNVTMGSLGSSIYQGTVPGRPEGSEIKYQFYANDSSNIWGKNDGSGAYFSYNIPAITPVINTPAIGSIAVSEPVTISVSVTDNQAVNAVILSWTNDYGLMWHNVTMILTTGTTYAGTVPGHQQGVVIKYKVYANDTSNIWATNDNTGALFSYTVTTPAPEFPWLWIVIIGGAILAIALVVVPTVRGKTKAAKKKRYVSEALFPARAGSQQKAGVAGMSTSEPAPALLAALPVTDEFEEKDTGPGVHAYRGGRIVGPRFIYKVKVKNTTDFIIADVTIHLASYPRECMTLATEEIRHVPKIEPGGFRSLEFELVPQKDCVEGSLISTVNYVDYKNELRTMTVQPFTLKSVCDLMEPLAIPETAFDSLVKSWARTQEIVTFKGENVRAMIEDVPAIFESKNFHPVAQKIKEDGDNLLAEIKGIAVGKYTKRKMALIVQVQAKLKQGEGEIVCVGLAEDPSMLAACLGEILVEFRKPLVRQIRRVLKERKGLCEVDILRQTLKVELPVLADAVRQEKDLAFLQAGEAVATIDYIAGFVNGMRKDYDSLPVQELEKELKPLGKPIRSIIQDIIAAGKVKAAWVSADEFRFKAETHKVIFAVLRYAIAIISGLITIILAVQSVLPK